MLAKQLDLRFAKLHVQKASVNSERCRVLRQQYALKMIDVYREYSLIVNIDESLIKVTNFAAKAWGRRNLRFSRDSGALSPGLGMIAALCSDGRVFYSLSFRTTDHEMMILFMHYLEQKGHHQGEPP